MRIRIHEIDCLYTHLFFFYFFVYKMKNCSVEVDRVVITQLLFFCGYAGIDYSAGMMSILKIVKILSILILTRRNQTPKFFQHKRICVENRRLSKKKVLISTQFFKFLIKKLYKHTINVLKIKLEIYLFSHIIQLSCIFLRY